MRAARSFPRAACALLATVTLAGCGASGPDAGVRAGSRPAPTTTSPAPTGSPTPQQSTGAPAPSSPAAVTSAPAPPPPSPTPASPAPARRDPKQRYAVTTTVLANSDHGPELCFGAMRDSLPPQCEGTPVRPFSWADVADRQSQSGTTWGSAHFVGTFDGSVFHLTERPSAPRPRATTEPERFDTPCRTPEGGWRVVDESKASDEHWDAVTRYAGEQPDVAGVWLTWFRPATEGSPPRNAVLNLAFTGDLERHRRAARARWGGPLCVTELPRSRAALTRVQERFGELRAEAARAGVYYQYSAVDEVDNVVRASVLIADDVAREWVDRRFGRGWVELEGILRPVG